MRRSRLWTLALIVTASAGSLAATAQTSDEAEIRRVITQYYIEGRRTADSTVLRQAFDLARAHMLYVQADTLVDVPIPVYVARVASARNQPNWRPGPPSPARVTMVDITGNAAVAKVSDQRPDMLIVDYMSLLKVGGRWTVVGKIFDRVPGRPVGQ